MPELPEAEYMVRRLRADAPHATIARVRVLRDGATRPQPARRLTTLAKGQPVTSYGRRAKSVLLHLKNGQTIRVRLGMSGHIFRVDEELPKYTRVAFDLAGGGTIAFDDARTFGSVTIHPTEELPEVFADLGYEPLDAAFSPAQLKEALQGTRSPIKPLLLDQSRIVGLGNIWAAESLWKAKIHPSTRAPDLTPRQIKALHAGIVSVLTQAVANTFKATAKGADFPEADLLSVAVYGRAGQPCRRCKTKIEKFTQAARTTFFCPVCQKARS